MATIEQLFCWLIWTLAALLFIGLLRLPRLSSEFNKRICLTFAGLAFSMLAVELTLAIGILDSNLIWTPEYARHTDRALNAEHYRSSDAFFRFNDTIPPLEKPAGEFRLAVLGDSFIWGDGLRREDIWSRKLASLLKEEHPSVRVLHWGRNGWATINQLQFLAEHGLAYQLDLLIVGWVSNDPDLYHYPPRFHDWQHSVFLRPFVRLAPDTVNFSSALINRFLDQHLTDTGYENWENKLYTDDNLLQYERVVAALKRLCKKYEVPLLVVLTPSNPNKIYRERFAKVMPIFAKNSVAYLDLYPAVKQAVGHLPPIELRANRANGHPGPKMTTIFAREVYRHLHSRALIPR